MRRLEAAPAAASRALAFALFAVPSVATTVPLAAQAITGLDAGVVKETGEVEAAVARLRDGWRHAMLAVGADADPELVVESIVGMMYDPIELVGFSIEGEVEGDANLALRAAHLRAEGRVRAAPRAMRDGGADVTAVRAEAQRALDEYFVVLGPWLKARRKLPPGAGRP